MSKIMMCHVWEVTYLHGNVTIVCGASYHLLGSQISWDLKIRLWLQVESYISNWRFSESRHSARYDSRHNAMAYDTCPHEWSCQTWKSCGKKLKWTVREQRNHCLKYESDCVSIGIGIKIWIVDGFVRDCFVEFLSSTPQLNRNILPVPEQVFIPAVSHMKIANIYVGTIDRNMKIALQFSYQFAIFISVCNFHISLQFSRFDI